MPRMTRRTLVRGSALATVGVATSFAGTGPVVAAPNSPTVLASGLEIPWGMVFLPDGNALVGERHTAVVHRVRREGGRSRVGVVGGGTVKLMGMALSPTYANDGLLYAHVLTAKDARILAMTYRGGVLGTPRVVYSGIPLGTDHHGGGIAFGPDGRMYVTVGDKGSPQLARTTSSLVGKTLRLNRNGTVPSDNPWGNAAWTKGHRNVEGITFDASGRLWAVEFGEDTTDELNRLVKGGDYGWPTYEGGDGSGPVKDPFVTWSPTSVCSPAGVAVKGEYAYVAALMGECLWRVKLTTPNQGEKVRYFHRTYRRIRTVALAPDGALWIATSNNEASRPRASTDDRIIRILT